MCIAKQSSFPPEIINPEGEILQEIFGADTGGIENHSLDKVTLPPGKKSVPNYHKKSTESYMILSGTATLSIEIHRNPSKSIEQHQVELTAGEAVLIAPFEVHQIMNHTNVNVVFLAVCVPAWQPDDSYEISITEE